MWEDNIGLCRKVIQLRSEVLEQVVKGDAKKQLGMDDTETQLGMDDLSTKNERLWNFLNCLF